MLRTKRVYDKPARADGTRVLVMRLWPRGIKKGHVDLWLKDLGAELGTLREGSPADVSVFEVTEGEYEFVDSGGKRRTGTQRLAPYAAIRDGRWFGLSS